MPVGWIDFQALKAQVKITDVLARYGFLGKLQDKGQGKLVGTCPVHHGKNPGSFHVNTQKNVYNCFSQCGGGNVLDLVVKIEGCTIREAGEKLASWFNLGFDRSKPKADKPQENTRRSEEAPAAVRQESRRVEEPVNPPLQRPLTLSQDHPYLRERGLTVLTVKVFGLGFCSRGIMRGRIAIPIHNEKGELVAYAGRAIDEQRAKGEGKYKLPTGFHKGHVVYNLHRVKEHAGAGLIVVEGFFDAMMVTQAGFPNVVALMGSSMTQEQELLLVAATDRLALMFDGDEAGVAGLRKVYGRIRRRMYLREIHLEDGKQPDGLSAERLKELLS
jgi:DNA primase